MRNAPPETKVWHLGGQGVPMLDRGLRYGMSVFETVGIRSGRPLFASEHLDRLRQAAHELLEVEASRICDRVLSLMGDEIPSCDGVLRIYVTAGPGSPGDACREPGAFAIFEPCAVTADGGTRALTIHRGPFISAPGGWKTGNYWQHVRAMNEAVCAGFDESVLLDIHGMAAGCSFANLFVVIGGRLVTPPVTSGARPGVVREWVMQRAGGNEEPLTADMLLNSEEIFLTNSRIGIARVKTLEGSQWESHPLAESLARDYASEILRA